ncbi:MAG TPA: HAD family hydrolase [Anaerolineae bacterium]|nr:HAD family hydrolase [Anaerolineae bacterium]HQH39663.1 HAD family hydrolase [Anaerolineae bacterium]
MFDMIAFDADDTLWQNESLYSATQQRLAHLLAPYVDGVDVPARLYETETRNIPYFGYGIKSFTLSMIETAITLTEGRVTNADIRQIITFAKEMIDTPTQLLDGVADVVAQVAATHTLMLITKGDLLDQQRKLERSGLAEYFAHIEIVADKTEETYRKILAHYKVDAARFLMVGNSLKSDVLPVVAIGGHAVYVPHAFTWEHERVDPAAMQHARYFELAHIDELPALVEKLTAK